MASPCEVHVASARRELAKRMVNIVSKEAWRVEDKLSRYRLGNIVSTINSAQGCAVTVDEETAKLLNYTDTLFELSEGRFDITSGVLRRAWRFDGSDNVPCSGTVRALMSGVGWRRCSWQSPRLTLEPDMEIDFGGIGKEYAVDRAGGLLARFSTNCLINFGGDLLATGPSVNKAAWQVGIESTQRLDRASTAIQLTRGALATSGDARRFLIKNGRRYGHVLDPTTGWPVQGAPRAVTVLANTCTLAGMLSTFALLQGKHAERFLNEQNVRYWCTW